MYAPPVAHQKCVHAHAHAAAKSLKGGCGPSPRRLQAGDLADVRARASFKMYPYMYLYLFPAACDERRERGPDFGFQLFVRARRAAAAYGGGRTSRLMRELKVGFALNYIFYVHLSRPVDVEAERSVAFAYFPVPGPPQTVFGAAHGRETKGMRLFPKVGDGGGRVA